MSASTSNGAAATGTDPRAKSRKAFAQAKKLMPGGVNSPVRAYKAVGSEPFFVKEAKGAVVIDLDGNEYVDYVCSFGPLILGHAPTGVLAAISKAAARGTSYGMPTEVENRLAKMVLDAFPSMKRVRFVSSGTEACMSAVRVARGATGRSKLIKCTGCYHGHADPMLVQAGSGATTLGTPSSPGVPDSAVADTILVPFNDLDAVREAFESNPGMVAAMLVEPVAGNMGCIPPVEGYLEGLRALCDEHGAVLLFDEVMTGFRVSPGGAQQLYGVQPDMTCLGKVIGGGLPCAAYGGRLDLMKQVAPEGPVYQAGTLSGNPLAMAAGVATLTELQEEGVYEGLNAASEKLANGLRTAAKNAGVPVVVNQVGSMLSCFFTEASHVRNYEDALKCDLRRFAMFFRSLLEAGVALPPSQFEAWFVSTAHTDEQIQKTVDAAKAAFNLVAESSS